MPVALCGYAGVLTDREGQSDANRTSLAQRFQSPREVSAPNRLLIRSAQLANGQTGSRQRDGVLTDSREGG
jgi:hypothetical protein